MGSHSGGIICSPHCADYWVSENLLLLPRVLTVERLRLMVFALVVSKGVNQRGKEKRKNQAKDRSDLPRGGETDDYPADHR